MIPDMVIVFIVLAFVIIFLILEIFRIDLIAMIGLLSLGWLGVLTPMEAISGFSSNAVIAILAVMIMSRGLSKAGVTEKLAEIIIDKAGESKQKLLGFVSFTVGILSSFMQNIGAAALFLPTLLDISQKKDIPASTLIMPMGFAAILGGTLTMIATSPLIVLNDFLLQNNLPTFHLLSVAPVGLVLLAAGISYFLLFGEYVFPKRGPREEEEGESPQLDLIDKWKLPYEIYEFLIPEGSPLIDKTHEEANLQELYNLNLLAKTEDGEMRYSPWTQVYFREGQRIAVLGDKEDIVRFARDNKLKDPLELDEESEQVKSSRAAFAEIVIPHGSYFENKTIEDILEGETFNFELLLAFRRDEGEIRRKLPDTKLKGGDTLVVHGLRENLTPFQQRSKDFIVITPEEDSREEEKEEKKVETSNIWLAVFCFAVGIIPAILKYPLALSLLTGAFAMVLSGVINIKEAYEAVDWKVVFLLAGLIPLGLAMEKSGAAGYLAGNFMKLFQDSHLIVVLLALGALSTFFSLFMSNVGATVVLIPIVINIAEIGGWNPLPLVLFAALCTGNSFILPTHHVNAMLMTPGGYQNKDYLKAGAGLTVIFLTLTVGIFYFFYF